MRVDAGAAKCLLAGKASLLPVGMTGVEGDFMRGDVIAIRDADGQELARGLANYSSTEARLLCTKTTAELAELIGYEAEPEMVHKNNLVLLKALP